MLRITKDSRWKDFEKRLKAFPAKLREFGVSSATKTVILECEQILRTGLERGTLVTPRLRPATLIIRKLLNQMGGSENPLVGRGGMLEGIKVEKVGSRWALVPRGTHRSGMSQKRMWSIHEKGALIPRTQKMISFFHFHGYNLGHGVTKIPARKPFMRTKQTWLRKEAKPAKKRIAKQMKRLIQKAA